MVNLRTQGIKSCKAKWGGVNSGLQLQINTADLLLEPRACYFHPRFFPLMSILSIKGVSKHYANFTALKEISLSIDEGSVFGLLGPNGAGKTSLIRIINQIIAPDSGEIIFKGEGLKAKHISQIGYLPEERGLYPKMKVGEQLLYLAQLKDMPKARATERINDWMRRFNMEPWWNKNVEELSKGMAQKVQFIATVIHEPRLLIFDEPFTGFDPVNARLIKNEILRLRDGGATVIFSTHRMESVEEMCDEIVLINKGEKILEGRLSQIRQEYKHDVFDVQLEDYKIPDQLVHGDVLKQKTEENYLYLRVSSNHKSPNLVAKELMKYGNLTSFRERIPSLNDIFIKKVQS